MRFPDDDAAASLGDSRESTALTLRRVHLTHHGVLALTTQGVPLDNSL